MVNYNMHIDPATFPFPDPPKSSVDKGSSPLTHHVGSTQRQPRSPGFIHIGELDKDNPVSEILETRKLNKQICVELVKGPPDAIQDDKPPLVHRKHSIKTVFSSRSKRKSLKENKKMPVATHRTSDGRKYGQILSEQIYDNSGNASTYEVNTSRRALSHPTGENKRKRAVPSYAFVRDVASTIHRVNGPKQPVREQSNQSSLENGEVEPRLSPHQTIRASNSSAGSLRNRLPRDRPVEGNNAAGQNEETSESLPRKSTTDDSLGLLRDLSQILSRGEMATLTASASQILGPDAEHQPRVRDFAANSTPPFPHARAAIRRRSRSPTKEIGKHSAATGGDQVARASSRSPENITLPPVVSKDPARPALEPPLPMTQEQVPQTRTPLVISYHSKAPSVVSAESTAEDIRSDASSGVISNAQSAVFVKVPPQPGPAPLTPLPALPEGLDNFGPATPRASQSSRRIASPESSPSKALPRTSPAGSQYRLYPSTDSSPPKRVGSPHRTNAATQSEQVLTRQSTPLRSKRRGFSFPRSDCLPKSLSVSTLDELERWKNERADKTRQKKLRDLARMKNHRTTIEEVAPFSRRTAEKGIYNEDVTALPISWNSSGPTSFPFQHKSRASRISNLSASSTLPHRDSSTLSQKISPIIVIAEQEPTSRVVQASTPKNSHFSKEDVDGETRDFSMNGLHPVSSHPKPPMLQGPEDESRARPVSSHPLPVPRPVTSRVPTAHPSHLLQGPSYRSLHYSSMHDFSGLETRLSAMERKNAMLERAFLAVLNTSAVFGGSSGRSMTEDVCADTFSGLPGRDGDRFCGTSEMDNLYMALENSMTLHSDEARASCSTSSGP